MTAPFLRSFPCRIAVCPAPADRPATATLRSARSQRPDRLRHRLRVPTPAAPHSRSSPGVDRQRTSVPPLPLRRYPGAVRSRRADRPLRRLCPLRSSLPCRPMPRPVTRERTRPIMPCRSLLRIRDMRPTACSVRILRSRSELHLPDSPPLRLRPVPSTCAAGPIPRAGHSFMCRPVRITRPSGRPAVTIAVPPPALRPGIRRRLPGDPIPPASFPRPTRIFRPKRGRPVPGRR